MTRYDPLRAPDPEEWLALDEQEQIALVATYHRRARARLPKTLERLRAEGLDRHEAIHAIGSVVAEHLWKTMNERLRGPDLEEGYFRRLEALTASDWLKGPG